MTWQTRPYSSLRPSGEIKLLARVAVWLFFVCILVPLFGLAVAVVAVATSPSAHGAEPATVQVIGRDPKKHSICAARKKWVHGVVELREKGLAIEVVYGMVMARAAALGFGPNLACDLKPAIDTIWEIKGTADEIADGLYHACMSGDAT